MEQELGYTCPQTKKQCDDECCVSAEDCHAEAINNIISNCEPEQLNQNKMEQTAVEWLYDILHELNYIYEDMSEYLNKAKEMEKQQIVDAANSENSVDINHGDQYYNETFKNK